MWSISENDVEAQLRKMGIRLVPPTIPDDVRVPNGPPPAERPGWEGFLVATKPAGETWPAALTGVIRAARDAYDAGTHEMVTCTTSCGWSQLYLRPRRKPAEPREYFKRAS